MAERLLPAPDAFATCPTDDKDSILEYYADTFEAVYVQLHPFIKAALAIKTEEFYPGTYLVRSRIVTNCIPVSWSKQTVVNGIVLVPFLAKPFEYNFGGLVQ